MTDGAIVHAKPRARDLGLVFQGNCGTHNAITDVPGVLVGYTTLIKGEAGPLEVNKGPVRTGVTAVLPRGFSTDVEPVWAGSFSFNGSGEMTGLPFIEEFGFFIGPVLLTNTHSLGIAHHEACAWVRSHYRLGRYGVYDWALPVVGETFDGYLNDIDGQHVTAAHVREAIECASSGPVAEGNVGGGTGMILYDFKGGTGTASRVIEVNSVNRHVGAIVQANFGTRESLSILGVPVGRHLTENHPKRHKDGSVVVVVATDIPMLPGQLKRVARRATLGIGRTGTFGGDSSGDIFIAFSTANADVRPQDSDQCQMTFVSNTWMDRVFATVVDLVEEAVLNALVSGTTMNGRDNHVVYGIDHDALRNCLRAFGRLD